MHRLHPHVKAVMEEMGESDPELAVRAKARVVLSQYLDELQEVPPFNMPALASFRGLHSSEEKPRHSPDSEIGPENGVVVLRVNRDRPAVRQRFSIGHEVGHTLFPEYQLSVRCRKPSGRDWADPEDQLETLCDVAASEILFPAPWFNDAVAGMAVTAAGLRDLAVRFRASPEATLRRFVEVFAEPAAAVFCSWKLKPVEARQRAEDRHQMGMFQSRPPVPTAKLRVDYAKVNGAFTGHIPRDKSLPLEGPIAHAIQHQEPCDGTMVVDFGRGGREYVVHAIPAFTPEECVGPDGAVCVALVVRPRRRIRA